MIKSVSVKWLRRHRACSDQVKNFQATFGEKVEITRLNLERGTEVGLDVEWLAPRLLMAAARKKYSHVRAAAAAEHTRVVVAEYNRDGASLEEFNQVYEAATAEYDRVMAAAMADVLGLRFLESEEERQ